jgi:hypothetical protein
MVGNTVIEVWAPAIAFVTTLLLVLAVKQWITRSLQELSMRWMGDLDLALILYFVILLPGVVVHELSHWLTAKLLGVKVRGLSIGPVRKGRSSRVSLGSIRVGDVDPLRASIIGMAPLVGGLAIVLLIGFLVLGVDDLVDAVAYQGVEAILEGVGVIIRVPDFWLWMYLIFSVSNAMLPSESDRASVRPVLIFLAVLALILLVILGVPTISKDTIASVNAIAGYLAIAFGLTLAVDLVFLAVIGILLWLTRRWQDRWLRQ